MSLLALIPSATEVCLEDRVAGKIKLQEHAVVQVRGGSLAARRSAPSHEERHSVEVKFCREGIKMEQ